MVNLAAMNLQSHCIHARTENGKQIDAMQLGSPIVEPIMALSKSASLRCFQRPISCWYSTISIRPTCTGPVGEPFKCHLDSCTFCAVSGSYWGHMAASRPPGAVAVHIGSSQRLHGSFARACPGHRRLSGTGHAACSHACQVGRGQPRSW